MKIALIANTAWNIYNFRLGLMLFLQSKGYILYYIAPYDEAVEKIQKQTNATYIPLQHLDRKGYNPLQDLQLCHELYKIFKTEKIDLAISYTIKPNLYGALASYFTNTKTISNLTGLGYVFLKHNLANQITKQLYKFGLRFSTYIVFQNKTDKVLLEKLKICSPQKTQLINGSGINTHKFVPSHSTSTNNEFIFLFIGRLLYDKGIRELILAAKQLSSKYDNIHFHLVGALDEGNPSAVSKQQLEDWISENKQLKYLGNQADVIPFINACNAVVLPSYREGIPRVLLEAMALEKPFVTTDSAGCADVTINGKNGFMASAASADSLFEQMEKMYLLTEDERCAMGKFGRKLVLEKYDENIIVEEYLKLILTLS